MNEIKRQLNKKLGDTAPRTNSVIQKIEQGKRKTRMPQKRKKSTAPVYIVLTAFVAVLALFLIVKPFNNEPNQAGPIDNTPPVTTPEEEPIVTDSANKALLRSYFFKKDGDVAYFHGEGNEYASFEERTTWLDEDYIAVVRDSGGGDAAVIYHLQDNAIDIVFQEVLNDGQELPSLEEVRKMKTISTFIEAPFESDSFEDQTITRNVPFKTPYGDLTTLVLETKHEHSATTKNYYADGLGLVGMEYIDTAHEEFIVASYLTTLNSKLTPDLTQTVTVYNESTTLDESYVITDFEMIDPIFYKMDPSRYIVTYRKLEALSNDEEIGVFSMSCNPQEQCLHMFVIKIGSQFQQISSIWGGYGNVSYSPDNTKIIIPLHATTRYETQFIERDSIFIFDLVAKIKVQPDFTFEYFDSPLYPILSYKWLDNSTIELEVADVADYNFDTIIEWSKGTKATKTITISLP